MLNHNGRFRLSGIYRALALLVLGLGACANAVDSPSNPNDPTESSGTGGADPGMNGTQDGVGGATSGVGGSSGGSTGINTGGSGGSSPMSCFQVSSTTFLDFDTYNGTDQSFLVAGAAVGGVYMGPWELTDELEESDPDPEPTYLLEMVEGYGGDGYALRISDQEAKIWGGGVGFWMTNCVDAATYSGIRLQVRGAVPTGTVRLMVTTRDTAPPSSDGPGACMGTDCSDSEAEFVLSTDAEEWTQIDLPWSAFQGGVGSGGVAAPLSGFGIMGIIFNVGLQYDEEGVLSGPYDLAIDEIGFF